MAYNSIVRNYFAGRDDARAEDQARQANALNAMRLEQIQRQNALAANPSATPEQYIRAGDAQTGAALQSFQDRAQADKQQSFQRAAAIAQRALSFPDEQSRKSFLQTAVPAYAQDFAALGANVEQGLPQMLAMPDAQLQQNLQKFAALAAPQKPIEVQAGASLVTPKVGGGYETAFTAPTKAGVTYHDAGDRLVPTDQTGAVVSNLPPIKKGTSPATVNNNANQNFNRADKLRDEYNAASKSFVQIGDAYTNLREAAREPTAAGDLSLIFQYMKMLDPGSVVREQEFANAQNAAGVPDRIRNAYNRLLNGERLNPDQRADFLTQAGKLYEGQRARHEKNVKGRYEGLAKRYGLNPSDVTGDLDVLAPQPDAAPAAPATSVAQEITATGPNGEKVVLRNGQWVPK